MLSLKMIVGGNNNTVKKYDRRDPRNNAISQVISYLSLFGMTCDIKVSLTSYEQQLHFDYENVQLISL